MDHSRLYSTRIIKSFDEDMADITGLFRDMAKKGSGRIRLLNYYHGLPINYPADLVSVDRGVIELDVHPQQAVALHADRYAFIKCAGFPHDIISSVQYVNVRKLAVSLTRFTYVDIKAEERNTLRLELGDPTDAGFTFNDRNVSGKLFDLSLNGAAVRLTEPFAVEEGGATALQFMLPNLVQETLTIVKLNAKLLGVSEENAGPLCRFAIFPDKQLEQLISHYLFQRQVEIIRELKETT